MYDYADKVIRYLTKHIIRTFTNAKGSLLTMDELNVISYTGKMYKTLRDFAFKAYLRLAIRVYKDNAGTQKPPDKDWLEEYLFEYNPVTKYVYSHEVDRKRAYMAEGVIASTNKAAEVDKAMRSWSRMTNQYAINITDAAAMKAYKDSGVKKVICRTEKDEKRCEECKEREGVIYDIDKIPPKPHLGCRCWYEPYIERNNYE